jgi:hypothetical protein
MTITVFHLRRLDELTEMALLARLSRGETAPEVVVMLLRERVRRPSLGWSVEQLEAAAANPIRRKQYLRLLGQQQRNFANALYASDTYVPVATVAGDLTLAYSLTNSHDGAWTESTDPRLTVLVEEPTASSHIGDLFRDDATGHMHLCTSDGFCDLGTLDLPQAA